MHVFSIYAMSIKLQTHTFYLHQMRVFVHTRETNPGRMMFSVSILVVKMNTCKVTETKQSKKVKQKEVKQ